MNNIRIREIASDESNVLDDMLYEAIFQVEGSEKFPRDIIYKPDISLYISYFGRREDDYCLVAEDCGKIVGAVWVRVLAGEIRGFGNIDNVTPEFAISLLKEYRNKGVGTRLMQQMIAYLKDKKYRQASLSVDKNNYAAKMYQKLGFNIVKENEHDYIMVLNLS